ncbi:tRNA pseudouridine(55) synthase TruB [Sphingobacteriales bacterium UPWRP_1]|nr:tRNA pseudouridine(55) synthase TruB [Sphingobacteriales bacterium TSM_CSM]PSJ71963.1 tRNA pseudouridine(55) synthase TruB [Sphingobacteriales bacterium UPWRP_1]
MIDVTKRLFNFEDGEVLLVNKPLGWTSFDVVNKLRYACGVKKIGHAGTLDPMATGLLIICIGRNATRRIDEYQGMDKEYTGTFFLGATTPSYDREKEPDRFFDIGHITPAQLQQAARTLSGSYEQEPPIFSAIKVDGNPLYIKARKGVEVEVKKRPVTIHEFELCSIELPLVHVRIVCSKGTYIRSIASDFGKQLQSGAYLYALHRTKIGNFSIENAWELPDLVKAVSPYKNMPQ